MPSQMSPVIHFEMPADDMERIQRFYHTVSGWNSQPLGPDLGGFYPRRHADERIKLTILVSDLHAAMREVERAGGRIIGGMQNPNGPDDMPGLGFFVNILDPEGNCVTLHEERSGVRPPGWDAEAER